MKRNTYLIAIVEILVIILLFVSCSARGKNDGTPLNASEETRNNKLPDIIELRYEEIKPETIIKAGDLTSFTKVKEEQLGNVNGEQINISLYSDKDNNIHGVFKHKGEEYMLNHLGYATDLEAIEIHKLQLVYNSNGKNIILVSGIGAPVSGYRYILFDESSNKWSSFDIWGTPKVFDLNKDGFKEVLFQFAGLHLNTPDLYIFNFNDGRFMIADINAQVYRNAKLDMSKSRISSKYVREQDDKVLVEISDVMGNEAEAPVFIYHLECDEQDSSLLRLIKEN